MLLREPHCLAMSLWRSYSRASARRGLPIAPENVGLRHVFASRAYRGTRNLRAVQVLLGHASIATTERYTAVDDAEIPAAMVAAGDLDNSDERLPAQHAMVGTS
jgi:site-specific recombinase XerD